MQLIFKLSDSLLQQCELLYLQEQFYHLRVDKALDRLSVYVGDEVSSAETCLVSWTALLHALLKQQRSECEERSLIALYNHLFIPLSSSLTSPK